ncbi:biotin transporter BioY [Tersicoccus sp. Bi-70]|uniref:biotin transporter BioY n=1 Tax=Tersicoccus sp. Bi-70 TaxID=1897634 RepID=UPI00097564C6|nr:biotin transporter BioY [Tersicoccus sp. Bi-70]OMH33049.1 BioY family transporter [Tersicoccus sp. Bi-70]
MPATRDRRPTPDTGSAAQQPRRRARRRWDASDLSLIGVFTALVAAASLAPAIPLVAGVPITLQMFAIMLTALLLGPTRAFAAVGLYVLLGLAGLPILAGFRGGLAVLAGPSAGYLIAFPFAAALTGALAALVLRRGGPRSPALRALALFGAVLAGTVLIVHPAGIAGLMLNARLAFPAAVTADVAFLPVDLLKGAVAVAVALTVHRAFPALLGPRR